MEFSVLNVVFIVRTADVIVLVFNPWRQTFCTVTGTRHVSESLC